MNQALHLLFVDVDRANVLVTWTHGRWLLPILILNERVRPGPYVAAWAGGIGIRARMVGQWLGRPSPNSSSIDWLAVSEVVGGSLHAGAGSFRWLPIHDLASSSCWEAYQRWALTEVGAPDALPSVAGPFGTVSWLRDVEDWVADVLGTPLVETVPYRTTAHAVAVGFATSRGRVFLKGTSVESGRNVRSVYELCKEHPGSFAATLAFCPRPDRSVWWLTSECPGAALADESSVENIARVAAACGQLQRTALRDMPEIVARLPQVDTGALAQWGKALLFDFRAEGTLELYERSIERACAAVASIDSHSLIHVDVDPSNVFLQENEVRFIDLDDLHRGPSPLIASMFADTLGRAGIGPCEYPTLSQVVYDAYERDLPSTSGLKYLWPALRVVSTLFTSHLSWTRVQIKVQQGEVHGVDNCVRAALARYVVNRIREVDVT